MPLPLDTSTKVGIVRRAKALGFLLLPFVVFAVIVISGLTIQHRIDSRRTAPAVGQGQEPTEVSNAAESTSATTYIVTGKY